MEYLRKVRKRRSDIPALDDETLAYLAFGTIPSRNSPCWRLHVSRFFDKGELISEAKSFYQAEIKREIERRTENA